MSTSGRRVFIKAHSLAVDLILNLVIDLMASLNACIALTATPTYQRLPEHLRRPWLDYIQSLGPECDRPEDQEVFNSPAHCLKRLNSWGMLEGCAYVTRTSRATHATPNWTYACIFHDEDSQNNRKREDRVVREEVDGKQKVVSIRQRDTVNRRLGCAVQYTLVYRQIRRGRPDRHYVGKWKEEDHTGHALPVNPFSLPPHRQSVPVIQQLKGIAQKYRFASLPYSEAMKLLKEENLGVYLNQKEYYNLKRLQPLDSSDPDSGLVLLKALQDEGFRYRTLVREEYTEQDPSKIVSQKLIQIVFWNEDASYLIKRFCAGHLLVTDATFNTNSLRMPLITSMGITNEGHPLPIAFSYCPGETAESYAFFLKVVREDILGEGVAEPAVILADMSSGMISAVKTLNSLSPGQKLQFCSWHAAQAIIARVRKGGYTSDEMDTVKDLAWAYIQSPTLADLKTNRQTLTNFLKPKEKEYITDTWTTKEIQTIACHTRLLRNLGCNATQ